MSHEKLLVQILGKIVMGVRNTLRNTKNTQPSPWRYPSSPHLLYQTLSQSLNPSMHTMGLCGNQVHGNPWRKTAIPGETREIIFKHVLLREGGKPICNIWCFQSCSPNLKANVFRPLCNLGSSAMVISSPGCRCPFLLASLRSSGTSCWILCKLEQAPSVLSENWRQVDQTYGASGMRKDD